MHIYPWLQHYPASVPFQINPDRYESLTIFLEEALEKYKNLPMFENMGKVLTYGEINRLTQAFAAYLQNHTNLQPGDHVAIQLPNLLQYPVAMLGILRAGMVVVNINPLYTSYELEQQLKDVTAKGIITLSNFAHNLASIIQNTSIKTVIITEVGDLLGKFKGCLTNFTVRHIKKLVPYYKFPKSFQINSFNKALRLGIKAQFNRVTPQATQPAFLQYTGGTTGISKGVVLTHKHIIANMEQMFTFMQLKLTEGKEIYITPLPFYHIFALTVSLLAPIKLGAKNVLITNPRDIGSFIKELRKHRFTFLSGVNTLFNSLLAHPAFASIDFSTLKISITGGVALQDEVADKWEKVTGNPLVQGYGLTEASPCISCNLPNGTHRRGTIGVPLPGTLIKIVDDQYQEVLPEQPGQLLVKGPQVMEMYWNNPEETKQVFWEGWLQTGDIVTMSKDGYLKVLDRKKEMINVSGFNVYPNEIENIVQTHPKVLEAAAVATWEEDGKEVVKLFVVKRDPSLTVEELITYCRKLMTNYKVPRYIEFRNTLPKSNVGKILRRALQEEEKQKQLLASS
ncbi:MAG: long-chain-fatty-acid--CoA ligase [Candidatus Amoebophilus sp. 36-38]|nr:MAG: long-chain-fatty-acid--CoA ligase [Candidatus Amoebophilus sp. 36-38]